jgi:hypothetical protein
MWAARRDEKLAEAEIARRFHSLKVHPKRMPRAGVPNEKESPHFQTVFATALI